MNEIVKVECKHTNDLIGDFLRVRYRKVRLIAILVLVLVFPALYYFSRWDYQRSRNISSFLPAIYVFLFSSAVIFAFSGLILPSQINGQKLIIIYMFDENEYIVQDLSGLTTYRYSDIIEVLET